MTTTIGRPARPATRWRRAASVAVVLAVVTGCGGTSNGNGSSAAGGEQDRSLTLYTCLNDTSIQPVINAFEKTGNGQVDLFRAPTGELNARVAADVRSGGLRADVVWGCDPLTMQAFVDQHLVGGWTAARGRRHPGGVPHRRLRRRAPALPGRGAPHRGAGPGARGRTWPIPRTRPWRCPIPRSRPPRSARSAGSPGSPATGWSSTADLRDAGAVQVKTPDDVTTGVAQGLYDAGMTTANSAYAAKDDGSPVDVAWPEPGAIAIYGPIALCTHSADSAVAKSFISFVVGKEGQTVLGASGSYPTLPGVRGSDHPGGRPGRLAGLVGDRRARRTRSSPTTSRSSAADPMRPRGPATGVALAIVALLVVLLVGFPLFRLGQVLWEESDGTPAGLLDLPGPRRSGAHHGAARRRGDRWPPCRSAPPWRWCSATPTCRAGRSCGSPSCCRSPCPTSSSATAGPRPTRGAASPTPSSACTGRACSARPASGSSWSSAPPRSPTSSSPSAWRRGRSRISNGPRACPEPAAPRRCGR